MDCDPKVVLLEELPLVLDDVSLEVKPDEKAPPPTAAPTPLTSSGVLLPKILGRTPVCCIDCCCCPCPGWCGSGKVG